MHERGAEPECVERRNRHGGPKRENHEPDPAGALLEDQKRIPPMYLPALRTQPTASGHRGTKRTDRKRHNASWPRLFSVPESKRARCSPEPKRYAPEPVRFKR